eukprot:m.33061 g.33061  ORF g.33061 m.33061 type:complete len:154 (-) comp8484_c0_seq1:807-1268(-)
MRTRVGALLRAQLLQRTRSLQTTSVVYGSGMKLLTQNMMASHVKGVQNGYPLNLKATEITEEEVEFEEEFIVKMLPRIDVTALRTTLGQIGKLELLPATPESPETNTEYLQALHHILLEINIVTGELECPESKTVFPVENGIPNMLLPEDTSK